MQTQNQIENFLFQGKFDEARECLNKGEKFNDQYLKNNFSQIAAKIIEAKEIDFIEKELGVHRNTAASYLNALVDDENQFLKKIKIGKSNYFINDRLLQILKNR